MSRQFIQLKKIGADTKFELTPLIDIIFILVLFFAVTSTFVEQKKGLTLTLPSAVSTESAKEAVVISVDQHQRVHWNGKRINESSIQANVAKQMKAFPNQQIILQADKSTPYVRIVSILDAVRTSGCSNIMLETEKS